MNRHARCCPSVTVFSAGVVVGALSMMAAVLGWFFAIGVKGGWR